jgi:hypothetical protein
MATPKDSCRAPNIRTDSTAQIKLLDRKPMATEISGSKSGPVENLNLLCCKGRTEMYVGTARLELELETTMEISTPLRLRSRSVPPMWTAKDYKAGREHDHSCVDGRHSVSHGGPLRFRRGCL